MPSSHEKLEEMKRLQEESLESLDEIRKRAQQTSADAIQLLQEYVQIDADGEETTIHQANERARRADDIIRRLKHMI